MQIKGTLRKAAGPSESISLDGKKPPRNRHLPEWRFLHFTTIVTVNRPICSVIRIRPHLLSEDVASRLSAAQRSRSLLGSGIILPSGQPFVKYRPGGGKGGLALPGKSCYNRPGKQKCGSRRARQHPSACTGARPTYTTAERPHRMGILYDNPALDARGGFCRCIPYAVSA